LVFCFAATPGDFFQRLILQPGFEVNVAASEVREYGTGSGLSDIQLGFWFWRAYELDSLKL